MYVCVFVCAYLHASLISHKGAPRKVNIQPTHAHLKNYNILEDKRLGY